MNTITYAKHVVAFIELLSDTGSIPVTSKNLICSVPSDTRSPEASLERLRIPPPDPILTLKRSAKLWTPFALVLMNQFRNCYGEFFKCKFT